MNTLYLNFVRFSRNVTNEAWEKLEFRDRIIQVNTKLRKYLIQMQCKVTTHTDRRRLEFIKKIKKKVQMKVWKHGFEKEKGVYFEPMVLFAFCNNK